MWVSNSCIISLLWRPQANSHWEVNEMWKQLACMTLTCQAGHPATRTGSVLGLENQKVTFLMYLILTMATWLFLSQSSNNTGLCRQPPLNGHIHSFLSGCDLLLVGIQRASTSHVHTVFSLERLSFLPFLNYINWKDLWSSETHIQKWEPHYIKGIKHTLNKLCDFQRKMEINGL